MHKSRLFLNISTFITFLITTFLVSSFLSPINVSDAVSDKGTNPVDVSVAPAASVSLDKESLDLEINPTAEGAFSSATLNVSVTTNSKNGYELYFSTLDTDTKISASDSSKTIDSDFTGAVTSTTMAANKWGYSLDGTNFYATPSSLNIAKIKDLDHTPVDEEGKTAIEFGVKVDTSLPSGDYRKTLLFTALGHDTTTRAFSGITTMQAMTPAICATETTPSASARLATYVHTDDTNYIPSAYLTDTRDGRRYSIRKYADGSCWMGETLKLHFYGNTALNSASSDLNSKDTWKPDDYALEITTKTTGYKYKAGYSLSINMTNTGYYYYTWQHAVAGSTGTDSICPKGWTLPGGKGDGDGTFSKFVTTYSFPQSEAGVKDIMSTIMPFMAIGFYSYSQGKLVYNTTEGRFWSKDANGSNNAYNFYFSTNGRIGNSYYNAKDKDTNKAYAFPLVCVARN